MWSTHKGQVFAHKTAEVWRSRQSTLVSLLSLSRGPFPPHTGCQLLHRVEKTSRKTAVESLTLRTVQSWESRCVGRLFVASFSPSSFPPSVCFWKTAQCNSCHWLCGWRWLDLSHAARSVQARSCCGILFTWTISLYALLKSSCGWLCTWRRDITDRGTSQPCSFSSVLPIVHDIFYETLSILFKKFHIMWPRDSIS